MQKFSTAVLTLALSLGTAHAADNDAQCSTVKTVSYTHLTLPTILLV